MINLIEITTESISILMCLHRLSGQKFVWKKSMCFLILLEILGIVMQRYFEINYLLTISIGIIVFLYIRWYLTSEIFRIAKLLGSLFVLMPCMQLTVYYITKFILDSHINRNIYGIVINLLIILGILFWKRKYSIFLFRVLDKTKVFILICGVGFYFFYLVYLYHNVKVIESNLMFQFISGVIGLGCILALLVSSEREKERKIQEVQLYETYNKSFEDLIKTIRFRQHEFDNHINAIKSMQYIGLSAENVVKAQNEYCDILLRENKLNKLLKADTHPLIIQVLHSKLSLAQEYGIEIDYKINIQGISEKVGLHDFIEISNILLDNAIQYLKDELGITKKSIVSMDKIENKIELAVSNTSTKFKHSELQQFFQYGYSTKDSNRGIGLNRLKDICHKNDIEIIVNCDKEENNYYVRFKLFIK